jgi:hypothetical protein
MVEYIARLAIAVPMRSCPAGRAMIICNPSGYKEWQDP